MLARGRAALATALLMLAAAATAVRAEPSDPAVPPGGDPGGIPVALIGGGVDYTPPAIASRLMRDGEGELTGYDYIDDDRRPFARDNRASQDMAEIILGEGQSASLIPLRADAVQPLSLGRALLYAGKSPARIIVIGDTPHERQTVAVLASAIRHFYDRLFVLAAGDDGRDLDQGWTSGLRGLANLLVVGAVEPDGNAVPGTNMGALAIDVATVGTTLKGQGARPRQAPDASRRAAGHIAALAARLRAVEPSIPATALKVRIAELARQPSTSGGLKTVYGIIDRPERYFWLE